MNTKKRVVAILFAAFSAVVGAELELKRIDPATLNKHPAYTQVTTVKGDMQLIFIAGQVDRAVDYRPGNNECQHADWRGQYIGTMDNIEKALASAGATWTDVVSIRRYTTDIQSYLNVVMDRDNPPPPIGSPVPLRRVHW
jgi:enamine deaminase RidA (YjgF/YER057c/UK114 family)